MLTIFVIMGTVTQATRELCILISEDNVADHLWLQGAITSVCNDQELPLRCEGEPLLDLLLKETIYRHMSKPPVPDLIIATYKDLFCDLKVIADLRKRKAYANVPIIVIVNEDIRHTACKFLEYGVTQVIPRPASEEDLKKELSNIIRRLVTKL